MSTSLRSRILAMSLVGTTLVGAIGMTWAAAPVAAPGQTVPAKVSLDSARQAQSAGQLAQASLQFQTVADDASQSDATRQQARIELALVREQQQTKIPQMKALLADAQTAFEAGRYPDATAALDGVEAVGADLGWQDNAKPARLRQLLAQKQVASTVAVTTASDAATVAAPGPVVEAPAAAPAAPMPASSGDIMGELVNQFRVNQQAAMVRYNHALKEGKSALDRKDFTAADARTNEALTQVETNRRFFSDTDYNNLRAQAEQQLATIKASRENYENGIAKDRNTKLEQIEKQQAAERAVKRSKQVDQLMTQSREAYKLQQLEQAADSLRQVLVIDPQNSNAKFQLDLIEDRINYVEVARVRKNRSKEMVQQQIANEELLTPYSRLLIYPEQWPELSAKRTSEQLKHDSGANQKIRQRLDENIRDLVAEQQPFERVIAYLREETGVNMSVNWNALTAAGVDRNIAITVGLRDVPLRKALQYVLSEAGGANPNALSYTVDDGVITITTKEDLSSAKYRVVRVYDIRDLLVQPDTNVAAPQLDLTSSLQGGTSGQGGSGGTSGQGGGGGGLFGQQQQQTGPQPKTREEIVKEINETLTAIVDPTSWDAGGGSGSVRELGGNLIVNQSLDNQVAVWNLLQQLRESRAVQIAIEARLLLVDNSFMDDFGFGWNLQLAPSRILGSLGATGITSQTTGSGTGTTIFNNPQTTGLPGTLVGQLGGGSSNNSMNLNTSVGDLTLDGYQLNLLMRATQADRRVSTVTAPRVTLFNGQRGYIALLQQQNYVSNSSQNAAAGSGFNGAAVATNLSVSTLNTGVVLDVLATVSADRRYVVMQVRPQFSQLIGMDSFTNNSNTINNGGNGNGGTDNGGTGNGGSGNSAATQSSSNILMPRVQYQTVVTMVSIPDGGTLLIGGQKMIGEAEQETGVPFLSKIPGLGRLFTNRTYVKEERTLLILIRPKIIIQREAEEAQFGKNYDLIAPGESK